MMRRNYKPQKVRIKYFGILLGKSAEKVNIFLAVKGHVLTYTTLPEYIRRFETRQDAQEYLKLDCEKVVDLRNYK